MQTILVPVDFSKTSDNAVEYAAQFAGLFNARLLLFHAYMLPAPVSEVPYVMITAEDMQLDNEKQLRKLADRITAKYPVNIERLVRIGIASDEIKVLLSEKKIDLVIMGMKGAGGFEKIIGSTTTNVIRKINTPVLIIPHDALFTPIKSITYASNFNYQTTSHLFDPLLAIARKFQAPIYIFHVRTGNEDELKLMTGKKTLELVLANHEHHYVEVQDNSINEGIHQYIQQNQRDLLVMVSHKHGFFDRIFSTDHTAAMAYETHIPMLVLQDKN